jgi:hypothetical protein
VAEHGDCISGGVFLAVVFGVLGLIGSIIYLVERGIPCWVRHDWSNWREETPFNQKRHCSGCGIKQMREVRND